MRELTAYRRKDGRIGIRNHIFVLPAVVCANQVALNVAKKFRNIKYIEHQHGCGQFGDDLENTRNAFVQMAVHPNVYSSLLVGLGCESISSKVVAERAQKEQKQKVDLVVIQEAGGTLGAGSKVEKWVEDTERAAREEKRVVVSWSDLIVGVMFEDFEVRNQETSQRMLDTLQELGVNVVVPDELPWVTTGKTSPLESSTGLSVTGAHVIIHLVSKPHAFGNPLVPLARWCVDEQIFARFPDDFDGLLAPDFSKENFVEALSMFVNGQLTVSEELGMDDFALYRIGPTV